MQTPLIAIIGAGHMGASLIAGLIKQGHPSKTLWASDPSEEKLAQLQNSFSIHTTRNNAAAVQAADVVIFAVKPQLFAEVATALSATLQTKKPLIISIATGIQETDIQQWVGGHLAIVRCMPNMAAMIGCGATALYANQFVNKEQQHLAESILRAVGLTVCLQEEKLLDIVTALSGSGPAYFFLIMESLQATAEALGLEKNIARQLTLQTALGAAHLAIESKESLEQLRLSVTSPGGTTEKAISILEENKIRVIFSKALHAAVERSVELATQFGGKK